VNEDHSRWYWFWHCVACFRLRFPGMYRQCGRCRRAWASEDNA
jgi:hypothetical protein